jgi:trehalose/maltose hydrolase-like predicted phosphorylase
LEVLVSCDGEKRLTHSLFAAAPLPFPSSDNGHTFWDHDTFTQPALTLLHPGLAQAALSYRLHRLPGARAKAAAYPDGGYRGAMFPWGA